MIAGFQSVTRCFHAGNRNTFIIEKRIKKTNGIRATTNTGNQQVR